MVMFSHVAPRSRRVLLLIVPLCALLALAVLLLVSFFPTRAVPASAQAEVKTAHYLTHFQNDLGVVSDVKLTKVSRSSEKSKQGSLILVNSDYPCAIYESSLVSVYEHSGGRYLLSGIDVRLNRDVLPDLNEMMEDFQKITGNRHVMLSDGFRSEASQKTVYERARKLHGETAPAARPGCSDYHTGCALGFSLYTDEDTVMDFTGEDDCAWLLRNCYRYGFVLRYPEDKTEITGYPGEAWHFRYVGRPHAYLMHLKNYCLEEYLDYVSHYSAEGEHIRVTDNENKTYEIYCVPASGERTALPVPADKSYTVSGDNRGNFIVTVKL